MSNKTPNDSSSLRQRAEAWLRDKANQDQAISTEDCAYIAA
ncbi:MAG: hypothetical protein RQ715_10385 [Methylococcales bacterium]|nr:hypothetical protein [Methylococcales bacterium]